MVSTAAAASLFGFFATGFSQAVQAVDFEVAITLLSTPLEEGPQGCCEEGIPVWAILERPNGGEIRFEDDAPHGFFDLFGLSLDSVGDDCVGIREYFVNKLDFVLGLQRLTGREVHPADQADAAALLANSSSTSRPVQVDGRIPG